MTKALFVNRHDGERIVKSSVALNKPVIRKLYWFCEPVGGKNSPLKYLPLGDRGGFSGMGADKMSIFTDKNGKCEHEEFMLSVCGLDQFKVSVGLQRDGSDKKTDETYQVWRRMYFSVRTMKPAFTFDYGPVIAEYQKHGIEPKKIAPQGGTRAAYNQVITAYDQGYALMQSRTEAKLEALILLVDRVWIHLRQEITVTTDKLAFRISSWPSEVPSSHILWPGASFATGMVSGRGIGNYDVTPYLIRHADRVMRVNIPGSAAIHTPLSEAAGRGRLRYRFTVNFCKVLNGFARSDMGTIVIANRGRDRASRPLAPRQGTMVHEMGHGLGMVKRAIQEYNEFNGNPLPRGPEPNPTHYQNGGGHCKTGAGGSDPNYTNGSCVMYHAGHAARPMAFCGSCAPIVKRSDMTRSAMAWP